MDPIRTLLVSAAALAWAALAQAASLEVPAPPERAESRLGSVACEKTGTGTCYYVADLPGSGGAGTYADPYKLGDLPDLSRGCSGEVPRRLPALEAGDVLYFRGSAGGGDGVYPLVTGPDSDIVSGCLGGAINPGDGGGGTAANPIVIRNYPGESVTFTRAAGTSPLMTDCTTPSCSKANANTIIKGLNFSYGSLGTGTGQPDENMVRGMDFDGSYDRKAALGGRTAVRLVGDGSQFLYNSCTMFDQPYTGKFPAGGITNHQCLWLGQNNENSMKRARVAYNLFHGPGGPAGDSNSSSFLIVHGIYSKYHDNHVDGAWVGLKGKHETAHVEFLRNWVTNPDPNSGGANGFNGAEFGYLDIINRVTLRHNVLEGGVGQFLEDHGSVVDHNEVTGRLMNTTLNAHGITVTNNRVLDTDTGWQGVIRTAWAYADRATVFKSIDHNCYAGDGVRAPSLALYNFSNGKNAYKWSTWHPANEPHSEQVANPARCAADEGVPAATRAIVVDASRYGPTALTAMACSDGIDNDGDGLVDYPDDPGCTSAAGASEGTPPPANSPPVFVAGDSYVSHARSPDVVTNVTWSDPDGDPLLFYWEVASGGLCNDAAGAVTFWDTSTLVSNLVESPIVKGLPVRPGKCTLRAWAWDGKAAPVSHIVTITTGAAVSRN